MGLQAHRAPSAFASAQALAHVLRRPTSVPDADSILANPANKAKRATPFGAARFASMVARAGTEPASAIQNTWKCAALEDALCGIRPNAALSEA